MKSLNYHKKKAIRELNGIKRELHHVVSEQENKMSKLQSELYQQKFHINNKLNK